MTAAIGEHRSTGASRLASCLDRARQGHTLILACDQIGRMTVHGLAGSFLTSLIGGASPEATPPTCLTASPPCHGSGDDHARLIHESRWLACGDLCERLLGITRSNGFTQVVYLDPWAASLHPMVRRMLPGAPTSLLDVPRPSSADGEEADYWRQMQTWFDDRPEISVLSPDDILLSPSILPLLDATGGDDDLGLVDNVIVIDESGEDGPAPTTLQHALARWPDHPLILISAHLDPYRRQHPDLLRRCHLVFDPAELSLAVYRAALRRAHAYVASRRVTCLQLVLRALPPDADIRIPARYGAAVGRRSSAPAFHADEADLHAQLLPSRHVQAALPQQEPAPHGPNPTWWASLGGLIRSPTSAGSADFALIACCYKYLQRCRIFIDSVARQTHPLARIELCLAAPGNPDGLYEYLDLVRITHPSLTIKLVEVPDSIRTNKGKMLNAAFRTSSAPVIAVTDCDLVLPPDFVATMLQRHQPDLVLGCWRTPMTKDLTAQILIGNLDPVRNFDALRRQWDKKEEEGGVRQGMLGYCQVLSRTAFARVMYPEEFEGFNQSDIVFIDRLREQAKVNSLFMKDYYVLHLSHSRDWTGTRVFL